MDNAIATQGVKTPTQAHRQVQLFLESYRKQNKSLLTIRSYKADITQFMTWCEQRNLTDLRHVSPPQIEDYLSFLEKGKSAEYSPNFSDSSSLPTLLMRFFAWPLFIWLRRSLLKQKIFAQALARFPLAVSSRKRHLSSLKNFFDFAVESNFRDPFKGFKQNPIRNKLHQIRLKEADVQPTPMLSREEWEKIDLFAHRPLDRVLVLILYYWGLRLHEVAGLYYEDLDFNNQSVSLKRKGGKLHHFRPHHWAEIQTLLKFIMAKEGRNQGPIFPAAASKKNPQAQLRPMSERSLYHRVKRMILKAKLNQLISPHSFRKACATNLYLKTKDLMLVRDYLNHSDAKVTQTYIDQVTLEKFRQG
jgi:integrase/recombinase XerD